MKTVAIIQARMGSERLPGKAMVDIEGYPMLARVVERTRRARLVDDVVVATTAHPRDEVICSWADLYAVPCVKGPEEDVLRRYMAAAEYYHADVIVRITADCPLIDPEIIDRVVGSMRRTGYRAEFASNALLPLTFPRGVDVEVFTTQSFRAADRLCNKPYEREHVTPYYHDRGADGCSIIRIPARPEERRPELRWCVDEQADLDLVWGIYARGWDQLSTADLIEALDRDPSLRDTNLDVKQKERIA